ncbi:two-component system regulatory protein YycI [Salirhabdus salicampi]|uniref:two-component system regulatory protein YycI n=1 Tax=Salirhabdus salicampi TaxID=476102 RepID=UPI0020C501E6|nr:two-component system regulatory protein YycI [Salirhabdus salicampi]MCP8617234.1 two-component system regulatory protein YycI [Salirhabdus salicampi]
MQWGQIKTIFIICFLALDIFLFTQYVNKQNQGDWEVISESTFEEQIEAEEIIIDDLPDVTEKAHYISARPHKYTEEEVSHLNQRGTYNIYNDELLIYEFQQPIAIDDITNRETIIRKVNDNVLYSNEYMFWGLNTDLNILLFFQRYEDQPVYFNAGGMLLVFLNEDNEMVRYVQKMLDDIQIQGNEKEIIKPIQAVEVLYANNAVYSGDEITDVVLGYHTLVPLTEGVQAFVPTWRVTINRDRNYFVNAMERQMISRDENEFIEEIQQLINEVESNWRSEEQ